MAMNQAERKMPAVEILLSKKLEEGMGGLWLQGAMTKAVRAGARPF